MPDVQVAWKTRHAASVAGARGSERVVRSVIIGVSGPRARAHADAYRVIDEADLVGVSARTPHAASEFARDYSGATAYLDHRDMLEAERPMTVHLNTPPSARLDLLRQCEAAGVAVVVVEKPIAIDRSDLAALRAFAHTTPMTVVVNHQLHFHRAMRDMQERVHAAGAVQCEVDASAGMNAAYQGTHVLQAARSMLSGAVTSLAASASGTDALRPHPAHHYAPDNLDARFVTDQGEIRLRCGARAQRVADSRARDVWAHKRIRVIADSDEYEWTMWGRRFFVDGHEDVERWEWKTEDDLAQIALTRSLIARDEAAEHPLSLRRAIDDYALILDAYEVAARGAGGTVAGGMSGADVLPTLRSALGL